MKIYTKSGDQGTTSLFGGPRVAKNNPLIHAYGTSDELNSLLGLIISSLEHQATQDRLTQIQHELFNIGSHLACGDDNLRSQLPLLKDSAISKLEEWIDEMQAELPPLTQFILPGGSLGASHAHLARTVCRRFERQLIDLSDHPSADFILKYTNRLSDALFVCARFINMKTNHPDIVWKK